MHSVDTVDPERDIKGRAGARHFPPLHALTQFHRRSSAVLVSFTDSIVVLLPHGRPCQVGGMSAAICKAP